MSSSDYVFREVAVGNGEVLEIPSTAKNVVILESGDPDICNRVSWIEPSSSMNNLISYFLEMVGKGLTLFAIAMLVAMAFAIIFRAAGVGVV